MTIKLVQKDICLMDGTKIQVDIQIPLEFDVAIDKKSEEWVEKMMIEQVLRGLKESIAAYKNSELSDRFLYPQKYIITNVTPFLGTYFLIGDDIMVDADGISNITVTENTFLLGHEMGHKIAKYKDTTDAFYSIASSFGMNVPDNEEFIREIYSDLCGIIVSGNNDAPLVHLGRHSLNDVLPERNVELLKRKVLGSVYHV